MSNLEDHEAEQARITEEWEQRDLEDRRKALAAVSQPVIYGYDLASGPDRTAVHPSQHVAYESAIVTRSAPRWAWDTMDETLALDAQSKAFDAETRDSIARATAAMTLSCELDDDEPISEDDPRLDEEDQP